GRLPLWSDHTVCGYPLLARNIENLYPVHYLSRLIGLALGWDDQEVLITYVLHLYAGSVWSFLYLRYVGADKLSSALGAFCFTLAGPSVGFWTNWPPYLFVTAYVPLAFLILERVRAGNADAFWTALWALCSAAIIVINSPMLTIKFFLLTGGYFLCRTTGE